MIAKAFVHWEFYVINDTRTTDWEVLFYDNQIPERIASANFLESSARILHILVIWRVSLDGLDRPQKQEAPTFLCFNHTNSDESMSISPRYLTSLEWLGDSVFAMTVWTLSHKYCGRGRERRGNNVTIKCFGLEVTHTSFTHGPFGRSIHVVFSVFKGYKKCVFLWVQEVEETG